MSNNSDSEREEHPRDVESTEEGRRRTTPRHTRRSIEKRRSMKEDQGRASSPELFRREEQISQGSNVAAECVGRRGEKRSASFDNQLLPSKMNKMDDKLPTTSKKVNVAMATSTQLPQQPPVTREELVINFMQDSRMNRKYSQECLEKNGWNYQKAAENFLELQKNGTIPAEAFQI